MKNLKKNNLYKSLNSAFEQFKDSPPDKVWDAVEIDLAKKQLDRDKKRFFLMHWSAAAIILFFVSFGIYKLIYYTNYKPSANKNNEKNTQINNSNTLANISNTGNPPATKTKSNSTEKISSELNQEENKIENNGEKAPSQLNDSERNDKPLKENIITTNTLTENNFESELTTSSKQKEDVILKIFQNENNEINNIAQTLIQTDTLGKQIVKSNLHENKNDATQKLENTSDSTITSLTKITADSLIKQSSDSSIVLVSDKKNDSTNQITALTPSKQPNKILSRLSVSAIFSPDYASRLLANNKEIAGYSASQFNRQETPVFAFSTGLKIGYDLSAKWNIQTGATYSYMEQTFKPTNIAVDSSESDKTEYSFMTSSGIVNFSSKDFEDEEDTSPVNEDSVYLSYKANEKLEFINIPLLMKYRLSDKKISIFAICGITTNILISKQVKLTMLDTPYNVSLKTNKINSLRNVNVGFLLGMGFEYNIFKGFNILMEPTIKCSFTSINKNHSVKSYPYSLGIAAGLSYHF